MNKFNMLDKVCINIDRVLRAFSQLNVRTARKTPGADLKSEILTATERKIASKLMRINHSGEVCAQALYLGQGLTARLTNVRKQMQQAAAEEVDHLFWCKQRLSELESHTSYLNPLWFIGSFAIGATAGLVGDQWSLGFVAETERQVVDHLERHLHKLPITDVKSHAILKQMHSDEEKHRQMAVAAGAAEFPRTVQVSMRLVSKIMTATTYWI